MYVNEEDRTFETRVKFIRDIFKNKYTKYDIMASCVKYKLNAQLLSYVKELENCEWQLNGEDPLTILKKI